MIQSASICHSKDLAYHYVYNDPENKKTKTKKHNWGFLCGLFWVLGGLGGGGGGWGCLGFFFPTKSGRVLSL